MASDEGMSQQPPDATRYFAAMGMAGALCPWFLGVTAGMWVIYESGEWVPWEVISTALVSLVCASGVAAILSVFGSLVSIVFCTGLFPLLGLPAGGVRFHSFAAGLFGFAPYMAFITYVGLLGGPWFEGSRVDWTEFLLLALVGPGIATVIFQLAGAWSAWPSDGRLPPMTSWRFGVRQILIATLWAAIILTLAKLTWPFSLWIGGCLLVWLVYQSLTMWLVLDFLNWWFGRRGGFEGGGGDDGGMRG